MSRRTLLLATLALLPLAHSARAELPKSLTVSAGDVDRRDVVVPVTLPDGAGIATWALRDDAGNTTQIQVGPGGRGRFILGELKAGQSRRYTFGAGAAGDDQVQVEPDGGAIRLR